MYQPICSVVDDETHLAGFECLSRGPKGTNFESAKVLFDYVRLKREETLVDRACVSTALLNAPKHESVRLSVNVHASTLGRDYDFVTFLSDLAARVGIPTTRLTVEIVEHAPPWDGIGFAAALERLREKNIRIALDDVGLGQSNFKMILDVCPDYLKLDKYFVEHCDTDRNRQAVIDSLVRLASHFGAEIVAEGVERIEERDTLWRYGVRLMQGNLYSLPLPASEALRLVGGGHKEAPSPLPLRVI